MEVILLFPYKQISRAENGCILYSQQNPFKSPVVSCDRVTPDNHFQDVRQLQFQPFSKCQVASVSTIFKMSGSFSFDHFQDVRQLQFQPFSRCQVASVSTFFKMSGSFSSNHFQDVRQLQFQPFSRCQTASVSTIFKCQVASVLI